MFIVPLEIYKLTMVFQKGFLVLEWKPTHQLYAESYCTIQWLLYNEMLVLKLPLVLIYGLHFIFFTLLNNYNSFHRKRKHVYINLWIQLTYPLTHETAINKYNIRFMGRYFLVNTVWTKCNNRKCTHLIAPAIRSINISTSSYYLPAQSV